MLLFVVVAVSFVWMHVAIRAMERRRYPALAEERYLSDVPEAPHPASGPGGTRAAPGQEPSAHHLRPLTAPSGPGRPRRRPGPRPARGQREPDTQDDIPFRHRRRRRQRHHRLAAGRPTASGKTPAAASLGATCGSRSPRVLLRLRGLDGVERRGRPAAGDRLRLFDQPAVLAGGAAGAVRRHPCASSTASWCRSSSGRRWTAISTASLLIPALGIGFAVQEPGDALLGVPGAGAAVRPRRRQLRLLHGQHLLLLPEEEQGQRPGAQRRPRQCRGQRDGSSSCRW